ncbi:hypothetical protein Q7C36_020763 [Tachysurus vachellii]|uniref:Uncharacterized protein n=1 Tax=Tachysurus vachellii TaxID=175792 RepID=A0AA88IWG4_TACVA|nr:hypothetical protein Q7C36_020763 [Tachysurus vachellii]
MYWSLSMIIFQDPHFQIEQLDPNDAQLHANAVSCGEVNEWLNEWLVKETHKHSTHTVYLMEQKIHFGGLLGRFMCTAAEWEWLEEECAVQPFPQLSGEE